MELLSLNDEFQPEYLVENYESLVWSERYARSGDFELISQNIAEAVSAMPLDSYVSLRDSTVPMIVESYKIRKPPRDQASITIKGRSFETVLERRASVNTPLPAITGRVPWMISADKESDAAYKAMRVVLGDIDRGVAGLGAISPAVSALDAIPEIDLTLPNDYSTLTTNNYEIKPSDLYTLVMEMIDANHRGIKSVRPAVGGTKVGVEIYNGADLTETFVLDARFDQMDDATYLLSDQGSANVAYVFGPDGAQAVLKTAAPEPSGLARRVLVLDLTSDTTVDSAVRQSRGLIELYKYNATALFDGQVAIQVAEGYNKEYFLGDILKLTGEYGLSQNVRVAEFIRTSDASGEKAYPAFEAVSE